MTYFHMLSRSRCFKTTETHCAVTALSVSRYLLGALDVALADFALAHFAGCLKTAGGREVDD